jgi:signal transduction histidine kinase/ActR/RegA family two-component response regulator
MPANYPFRRLPTYSLAALAIVVVAVIGGIYLVRAQAAASARVTHTIEVQVALTEVLEKVRAVESAVRGYVNSRRPELIEDLALSARDLSRDLAQVRALTADNPVQQRYVQRLKTLIDERIAVGRISITLTQQGREAEMREMSGRLRGRAITQQISDQIDAMKAVEQGLFDQRVKAVRNAVWTLTGGFLFALVLIIGVAAALISDTRRRYLVIEQARDEARLAAQTAQAEMAARQEAETRLRQMQKMESIGQLTGGIAHDFNNMLAIVIGSLDLAERRLQSDPERALQSIDNAREGAQRAATLTARLLAFSRQQPLAPIAIDANKLVSGMSELLRRTLGEHISVETVLAGGLWTTFVDPGQLENALVNLAVNARDAMVEGGRLTIETANSYLDEDYASTRAEVEPGQYVVVCVTDTGSGMSQDVAAQAFEPFFTTKEVGKGTGLGLSQVFGFVKQSGGHVAIYSEVGEGSTVKLYLPRHAGPAAARPGEREAVEVLPHGRPEEVILVVEDEQRVRHFAIDALRDLGYTAISATDGLEGLKVVRQQPHISLLLTDIVMPRMNGRELADQARLIIPNLPVLYTTGYTRNAVVHNGILDPGVALLAKPFTMAQLAHRVRAMLDDDARSGPAEFADA